MSKQEQFGGREEVPQEVVESKEPEIQWSQEKKEILENIDFDKIKEIFLNRIAKFGIGEDTINVVPKEKIEPAEGDLYSGYYNEEKNIILLENAVDEEHRQEIRERYGSEALQFLKYLLHEETHAVAKNIPNDNGSSQNGYFRRLKASNESYKKWKRGELFHGLNEGVIEKFSREIFFEYVKQVKWPKHEVDVYRNSTKLESQDWGYSKDIELIEVIVNHLANKNNIAKEEAWELMVGGLVQGETFENSELERIFSDSFGTGFLKDLAKINASFFTGYDGDVALLREKYDF